MRVHITGKNLDIGPSLRAHVESRIEQLAERYFDGAVTSHVTIEKQRQRFHSECTLHLATGLVLQAHGDANDAYAGFDGALGHLEKQLRRYKQRLKNHHKTRREPVRREEAASYVITPAADGQEPEAADNPVVIAETPAQLAELTVGEAVMQLDISTTPFVIFRNVHGGLNVVYRRPDGNIGWIDPSPRSST